MKTSGQKPDTYDFWSASARHAYDEMEARALDAEKKLSKVQSSLDAGIASDISHNTLSWNTAMMRMMNEMLHEAASSLNPASIFDVATRNICTYLNATSVYICDWNSETKTTTVLADYISAKASEREQYSDVGEAYQADEEFEKRLTGTNNFWISHHDEKLSYTEAFQYEKYDVKTSIYVPMYAGQLLIGYVEVWDTSERREFTDIQTEFLVYVTDQIASSVRMAQLHRAMVESEQRYRTLMNTIESGVARIDMKGNIQFVNRHFVEMLNMPREAILHQNLEKLWRQKAQASDIPDEYQLIDKNGNTMWVQVIHAPIPGESGSFIGEAVVYSDITRRKEAEQLQIRMALENERMNLLAGFIKDTSHEFYTPISIINTRLFMLRRQYEDEDLLANLDTIEEQADNVTALIKALVEMTKLDAMDTVAYQDYNLSLLVEQVVTKFRQEAIASQKTLHFESDNDNLVMGLDAERLSMAISELIENALNYTSEHGTIVVRVREQETQAQIIVKDTGIGISDEDEQRIFERLYRADEARSTRGFGLGLPIARRIIELHGW